MRDRSEVLAGRFTPREKKVVQIEAKKQGMSESQYVRSAVMMSLILDGNLEAAGIVATMVRENLGSRWKGIKAGYQGETVTA